MKRFTAILMSMMLVFSLAACKTTPSEKEHSAMNPESQESEQASNAATTGRKALVVYYSATGSTEKVAKTIAAAVGGDTLQLVPVNEYSSDDLNYGNQDSRVVKEHDDPSLREIELVKNTVDNWAEYDTVFIGYPIWWHIAAWPVNGFVKANDFSGKTVIPFCTSASSGLEDSGKLLEEMAGTGNWLTGQRFSSGAPEQTVRDWVNSLKLNQ